MSTPFPTSQFTLQFLLRDEHIPLTSKPARLESLVCDSFSLAEGINTFYSFVDADMEDQDSKTVSRYSGWNLFSELEDLQFTFPDYTVNFAEGPVDSRFLDQVVHLKHLTLTSEPFPQSCRHTPGTDCRLPHAKDEVMVPLDFDPETMDWRVGMGI